MTPDDQLPSDLQDVARRLEHSRTQATPLELDALEQRIRRRVDPGRRRPGRIALMLRFNAMALLLTVGLVLTSSVSVVLAAKAAQDSKSQSTSVTAPQDAAACEYTETVTQTFTGTGGPGNSNATITITFDCGTRTICIDSSKGISNYQFNNKPKVENFGDPLHICVAVPPGATSITIKAGTTVITFQIPATAP